MRRLIIMSMMCLVLGLAARSQAALETFDLAWSGASLGNSAMGTGTITIETSLINSGGFTSLTGIFGPPTPWVTALSVTISGATNSADDGTFGLSDYDNVALGGEVFMVTSGPLDFSQNLVGQANFADFNFFADAGTNAPSGVAVETIQTGQDQLVLTSFTPAVTGPTGGSSVPLPSALPLGLLGLGTLALAIRRHKAEAC